MNLPQIPFHLRVLTTFLTALATTHTVVAQATLSGRVTSVVSGGAVVGADIDLFDQSGASVVITGGQTGIDGTYTLALPGPGLYRLRVDMKAGDSLADQYFGGGIQKSAATPINVPTSSSVVTGIDIELPAGHSIGGQVVSGSVALGNIDLDVYSIDGEFLSSYPGTTAIDGRYEVGPLPTGSYYLKADADPALGQLYVDAFYGDTMEIAGAAQILISNTSVLGKDINLAPGGVISGTIFSASNAPLDDIDLDLFYNNGSRAPFSARSLLDGSYAIGSLPAGSYYLRADPSKLSGYARALYPNELRLANASLIEVTVSQTTIGIDFVLQPAGTISGTIRDAQNLSPLAGVDLDVFDAVGNRLDFTAKTATDGSYRLGPFPFGEYLIRSDPLVASAYVGTYYDSIPSKALAVPVSVAAGVDAVGINFNLSKGGWVAGAIRDLSGGPLTNIDLDVYDLLGARLEVTSKSTGDGSYLLGPLPVGSYLLRADPATRSGHLTSYFPNSSDLVSATPVPVSISTTTPDIDFSLADAGWIEGVVRDELGFPMVGIDLDLFDASTLSRLIPSATSQADGRYEIGPLPVKSYLVRADPTASQYRVREYYSEAARGITATPVIVSANAGSLNVDFTLDPGASISGIATSFENGSPVSGADIDVFRASDMVRMDQSAKTSVDGTFLVGPLPQGAYVLRVDALSTSTYVDTYFGDTTDPALATPIDISPPTNVVSIGVSLSPDSSDPLIGGMPVEGLEGWFLSDWFGYYSTTLAPWLFHAEHGFIFRDPSSSNANMYVYDDAMTAWWWTNETFYPFIYSFNPPMDLGGTDIGTEWLFYFELSNIPRAFGIVTGAEAGVFLFFDP